VKCVVPRVVGLTLPKAKTRIRHHHCSVGRVTRKFSTLKKKGRVLTQVPKAGRRLPRGARVRLVVGKGPRRPRT
jgi:beta-lactam-binding protein with PASTA domain